MEIKTYFVTCLSKAKNFASGPASEWTNDQRALYWIFIDQIVCFITMIQFMHIMYKISLLYKHPKSVFRKKGFSFDEMFQYKTFQIFSSKFAIDLEYESHIHSRKYGKLRRVSQNISSSIKLVFLKGDIYVTQGWFTDPCYVI